MKLLIPMNLSFFGDDDPAQDPTQNHTDGTAPNGDKGEQQAEKTFTQTDVDNVVKERLDRERKKLPPKEKLDAFAKWEAEQQTEAEKQALMIKELADTKKENANLAIKARLLEEGIPKDLVKYAMLDIQEADGDIDAGIEAFKASDIFKVKQQALNYGVKGQVTDVNNHTSKSVTELMKEANEHPERLPQILAQIETINKKQ